MLRRVCSSKRFLAEDRADDGNNRRISAQLANMFSGLLGIAFRVSDDEFDIGPGRAALPDLAHRFVGIASARGDLFRRREEIRGQKNSAQTLLTIVGEVARERQHDADRATRIDRARTGAIDQVSKRRQCSICLGHFEQPFQSLP